MDDRIDAAFTRAWLSEFVERFRDQCDELTELDRISGDGDFGTNLLAPLERVRDRELAADATSPFGATALALMRAGGTSGPLLGAWFRELGRACPVDRAVELHDLATGVLSGTAAVQRLGGAKIGDCTMVDAMAPAGDALRHGSETGASLLDALRSAATAARAGAASTTELIARRGRASYVGEVGRGVADPGAVAIALFFESAPGVSRHVP